MSGPRKAPLLTVVTEEAKVVGEWEIWTPDRAARRPDLAEAVERFEPLNHPAGEAAARWLREDSLTNDPSTKTYLSVVDAEVHGFFACCAGTVALSQVDASDLAVPHRQHLPAFVLAWVARRRGGVVPGLQLVATAYGLARDLASSLGMVAFVLDPMDDQVARIWQDEPYAFREAKTGKGDRPARLWLPLG
jgi:hypothetical protein